MIFVDTGAWIALLDRNDQYHNHAISIYNNLKEQKERLLTTDYVLDETITRLRYDLNHQTAVTFLNLIEKTQDTTVLTVLNIDTELLQESKAIFRQFDTAILSFTDCTSFAVCLKHGISETFSFDSHFSMMGIRLLT